METKNTNDYLHQVKSVIPKVLIAVAVFDVSRWMILLRRIRIFYSQTGTIAGRLVTRT